MKTFEVTHLYGVNEKLLSVINNFSGKVKTVEDFIIRCTLVILQTESIAVLTNPEPKVATYFIFLKTLTYLHIKTLNYTPQQ